MSGDETASRGTVMLCSEAPPMGRAWSTETVSRREIAHRQQGRPEPVRTRVLQRGAGSECVCSFSSDKPRIAMAFRDCEKKLLRQRTFMSIGSS